MIDFLTAVNNILDEKNLKISDLVNNGVVSKNTLYKYRKRNPNLQTLIKIANYLNVSIDYMFEYSLDNHFCKYSLDQSKFYDKLSNLIKSENLSYREFCRKLNYSKANIIRYKNGVEPSLRTLIEIKEFFKCQLDDLIVKEEELAK